jgi:hypothetical protein
LQVIGALCISSSFVGHPIVGIEAPMRAALFVMYQLIHDISSTE